MKVTKKENFIVLKSSQSEITEEEAEMAYVKKRFQKIIKSMEDFKRKRQPSELLQKLFVP